ncbi:recombinase family protein [Paenibacillus sp. FSL E2-0201]|uniref:recombinase family protein n=1 Tax=Paenibacillus sp. FSL E2-0201 TaxID=2954726 RepID=UPI0030DA6732
MRYAIYARVSTDHDSQKESVGHQIAFFNRYVEERSGTIYDVYKDEGVSGTSIKGRSDLQRLLRDARAKNFEYVLFKSISRFARDIQDGINIKRELDSLGIGMIFIEQNIDTRTADGELMFSIHLSVAQQESEATSKRVKFGRREKAAKGKFNGSLPPFGYIKNGNILELDPKYSLIVKELFRLYLYENMGLYKLSRYLNNAGIPTPRAVVGAKNAGVLWQQSTIKLILTNPLYTGNMVQNRTETISLRTNQRKEIPAEQQTVVPNTHPSLISMEEFHEAQMKLKLKGERRSNGQESLFAHIAVCADCGMGMHFKKDRGGYTCGKYGKYGKKYCSSHYVKADDLLSKVKQHLKLLTSGNQINTHKLVEIFKKESGYTSDNHDKELRKVESKLSLLAKKQSRLLDLLNEGELLQEEWRTQNTLVRNENALLSERKAELMTQVKNEKDLDTNIQVFEKQVKKLLHIDFEDERILKQIVMKLIQKIEVFSDGNIKIHYNIAHPKLIHGA